MRAFLIRRLATFVPTLLLITLMVFGLQQIVPGGPAEAIAGAGSTQESIDEINRQLGLDRPLVEQYTSWIGSLVRGDLGTSYFSREPVDTLLARRLEPTVLVVVSALVLALVIGGGAGLWAAARRRHLDGRSVLAVSGIGLAVPDFWLATIAAGFIGLDLALLPAVGYTPLGDDWVQTIRSIVLPVLVLSFATGALVCRHVRSAVGQALDSAHIRTAWAMGLSPRQVYLGDALRSAAPAVVTLLPLLVATLVGASVVVENVFAIPGLGSLVVQSVDNRDYATLQGAVLLMALLVLVLNFVADLVLARLDRRVAA
ncbi:ABC transporter permease [Micromonospora sp. NPDC047527]|uniref:ABC transporter permease n=1 Tax=unclassified Micromonospora TaxID=2617518 RepID=UPI00340DE2FE